MSDLRYPVGKFVARQNVTEAERQNFISSLDTVPAGLQAALAGLTAEQLDTPYRPDGWTVRQTVHHTADSHMNAYIRFRLGLTEEEPTIKPYDENQWALLADARTADPKISLQLLDALHQRWTILLRSLPVASFARLLTHPESGVMSLDVALQMYEWHGRHHIAHITALRERMGW